MPNFVPPQMRNLNGPSANELNEDSMRKLAEGVKQHQKKIEGRISPPIQQPVPPTVQPTIQGPPKGQPELEDLLSPMPEIATEGELISPNSAQFFKKVDDMGSNPLRDFFRRPAMYIRLPTQGHFNKPGEIEFTATGDVAIYPMTSADEIMLKNPDALLNGEAVASVIKSCVPAIKNVRNLAIPDFDIIMHAIRSSTFGEQMDIDSECTSCKHKNSFGIHLPSIIQGADTLEAEYYLKIDDTITVQIKPYNYEDSIKAAIVTFEESKLIQTITKENVPDEEKVMAMTNAFTRIAKFSTELVANNIMRVIVTAEVQQFEVTETPYIHEWLSNTDKKTHDRISDAVKEINAIGTAKKVPVTCAACNNEYETDITFDPARFFA